MKDIQNIRNILNTVFLLLALVGVVLYFAFPTHHVIGLVVVAVALMVKIVEFFLRYMF